MTYMNREHLIALADRCEAGAEQLTYEAEHAAEVLAGRAGGDRVDPQEWAARQQSAAAAARQYAAGLRAEAASMGDGKRPSEERIRQAEKVADAANLGGILIDGSRLSQAAADRAWSDDERTAIGEHQQAETAAIVEAGVFEHVTETADGVGQVPFWQLAAAQPEPTSAVADCDDTDGY